MAAKSRGTENRDRPEPPVPRKSTLKNRGSAGRQASNPVAMVRRPRADFALPAARFKPPAKRPLGIDLLERDSYSSTMLSDVIDRSLHAAIAGMTAGLSPSALGAAYLDWATHLAYSPGKQALLYEKALRKTLRFLTYAAQASVDPAGTPPCIEPLPQDRRFRSAAWQNWPFNLVQQAFLLQQQWWHNATTSVRGVTAQHERMVAFTARQALDIFAPSNFVATNPDVLDRTQRQAGANLIKGFSNFLEDCERNMNHRKPVGTEGFVVGQNLAMTPGKVVYRNRLIELIQYAPTTQQVQAEPLLIVPAWIMKYYVLDLSQTNSLVRYLVDSGFTVFMISWKNPEAEDRDLSMEDYRALGVMAALDAVSTIIPGRAVHGIGYCLGGTLLTIAAAAMARDDDHRLGSLTLLAAQTDFTEAGELMLFIDESQLAFLEDVMWEQGFLDTKQMSGAFQLLRSNDLIWSRLQRDYLMGERGEVTDLMAWNADLTRMPYRMHSEYLHQLFLNNDLAEGRYRVDDEPIAISDIRLPIFAVGTERDHVAPWRSVYKIHLLSDSDVTFLLTSGGHNAGIVSEPGHPRRSYRLSSRSASAHYLDPENWYARTASVDGSWWPEWCAWLTRHCSEAVAPPALGAADAGLTPLCDAPGAYVLAD